MANEPGLRELITKWMAEFHSISSAHFGDHIAEGIANTYRCCAQELDAALAARSSSEGARDSEVAWLIERNGLCLGFSDREFKWVAFTNQAAFRLSRYSDAVRFIEAMQSSMDLINVLIIEHMWTAPTEKMRAQRIIKAVRAISEGMQGRTSLGQLRSSMVHELYDAVREYDRAAPKETAPALHEEWHTIIDGNAGEVCIQCESAKLTAEHFASREDRQS